ncbi:hypothetical protein OTU49_006494 [Cherax quadricarinatus]|uniref:Uncharacterized protein n=1 Tax=Cherax quadricarinatus TaxID=27406 RepID=A0AAW0WQP4_CHEQU
MEDAKIKIPYMNLVISLISLTVPITIGIIIRLKKPTWADKGAKILKPFSLCILLFFFTVGSINSYKIILTMTWQMVVAGVMVMSCGYFFGAAFAKLVCLNKKQIIAVSIETALQNAGVAFVVVKLSLETPYSDMASVPIIATLFMSGPPLILAFLMYTLLRRCCGCCPNAHLPQALPPAQEDTNELKHLPGNTEGEAGEVSTFLSDPRK